MKISYNWLKEHIALDWSTADLSKRLLHMGFEVEAIERLGPRFSGVVIAQIAEIVRHPNADRLSLCVVDDGKEKLSVVCGAKNIAVGQKVPLARVGARLPGGLSIGKSKIRGVESQGMICSAEELGLGAANGGILVLDPGTEVGADFAKTFGESDEILDVEITPNRPDCLSHLGLARELSAHLGLPLTARPAPQPSAPQGDCWPVAIDAPAACPRYVGRVLTGLKIGPSPAWLSGKLEAIGLRPINNLVDITNFILMDLGQPLHAFDLDRLSGGEIRVRFAAAGETIKALDGKDYALTPDVLVIADGERPQAIAGVMGGQESGVTEKTTRAFLESAYFNPPVVRKASQKLRLRSDSSYRFERGCDPDMPAQASARAAELILKLCGGAVSPAALAGAGVARRAPIVVSAARVNEILGSQFESKDVGACLRSICAGFEDKDGAWAFQPPSYRGDLETVWDLAEETARLLSYESIPSRLPTAPLKPALLTRRQAVAERARKRLQGFGLCEAYNYDFVSAKALAACRIEDSPGFARLANPISEDWTILRPALLPGLLQNAALNARRGAPSARLFELGKVYARAPGAVDERHRLAAVLYGPPAEAFWKPARAPAADVYEALGVALELLCGLPGLSRAPFEPTGAEGALFNPGASVRLQAGKTILGAVGQLHPQVARAFDLERHGATIMELDFEALCALQAPATRFAAVSQFPYSRRDLSIVVEKRHPYAAVEAAIRDAAGAELLSLDLIDVFEGKGIPEGKRSLTLRLTFGRDDRTLKDAEVAAAVDKSLAALKAAMGADLRA